MRWLLRLIGWTDRWRLRWVEARTPGLRVSPEARAAFAFARYDLAPGARLVIGAGAVTERRAGRLHFELGPGARVTVGEGVWLRTELAEVHVVAFAGARIDIGPEAFLNGTHVSAKREVRIGRRAFLGPGTRIFDSDQHDFDAERPERTDPVRIGDHVWIASDVTVLRGVSVGDHSIVGARSVVTRDVPAHRVAVGSPASVRGEVGDRSATR